MYMLHHHARAAQRTSRIEVDALARVRGAVACVHQRDRFEAIEGGDGSGLLLKNRINERAVFLNRLCLCPAMFKQLAQPIICVEPFACDLLALATCACSSGASNRPVAFISRQ